MIKLIQDLNIFFALYLAVFCEVVLPNRSTELTFTKTEMKNILVKAEHQLSVYVFQVLAQKLLLLLNTV